MPTCGEEEAEDEGGEEDEDDEGEGEDEEDGMKANGGVDAAGKKKKTKAASGT
jgi:hypothetical protein